MKLRVKCKNCGHIKVIDCKEERMPLCNNCSSCEEMVIQRLEECFKDRESEREEKNVV